MLTKQLVAAASLAVTAATSASAQSYPGRPMRIVVPYTSGSPVDVLARAVAQDVSARVGQPIIIDNRAGAGTTIGTKAVATAAPDGYTLLINGPALLYSPVLYPNLDYQPLKAFAAIAPLASWSHVLVVAPGVPAKTLGEFISYARANPGKVNFGFGLGTVPHILGELLKVATKTEINSVSYRGGAQAVTDLLGGRIQMNFGTTATLLPWIAQSKVKAVAYTGPTRARDLPDVPTFAESGYPQLALNPDVWQGVFAPAGVSQAVVQRLNALVSQSISSPQTQATLSKLGFEQKVTSPQEFALFLAAEAQKWPPIIKTAGIRAE